MKLGIAGGTASGGVRARAARSFRYRFIGVAFAGLTVLGTLQPATIDARKVSITTEISLSANPATLVDGPDVTLTSTTTASGSVTETDGRVTFQLATDGFGRPRPASDVVKWVALNPPGDRPANGLTTLELDLDTLGFAPGVTGGLRAVFVPGSPRSGAHQSTPVDVLAIEPDQTVGRIDVSPGSLLLTHVGDSRRLDAQAYDADGRPITSAFTWISSRPEVVNVQSDGTLNAVTFGSAQVTAAAGGAASLPVLVVVGSPAPGAVLVSDAQVVGDPEPSDPNAVPSLRNTYRVTLRDVAVTPGDLVVGTGEKPVGGRAVDVMASGDGSLLVTLESVPLPQLLPGLRLDESIDLSRAQIIVPDDVAAMYHVLRDGNTFTLVPRPDVVAWRPAGAGTSSGGLFGSSMPRPVGLRDSRQQADEPGSVEFERPPFKCTASVSTVPLQLTEIPGITVTIAPSLDVATNADGDFERFVVAAQPSVKLRTSVSFTAAFEGKVECTLEVFAFVIPIGGVLSPIGGLVPVGVGFEAGGKITVGSLSIAAEAEAGADMEAGIVCASGGCGFHRAVTNLRRDFKPKLELPSLGQVRLEPSFAPFAFMKLAVGSPFFTSLRVEAIEARIGLNLSGNFAPRVVQILDTAYASDYKLDFQVSVKAAPDLGSVASALGISELATFSMSEKYDIARSAAGTVFADRASYGVGDDANVRVRLDPASVTFLTLDNVAQVQLVHYAAGSETILATQDATSGQTQFDFNVPISGPTNANELTVFVVPSVLPDILPIEIGQATPVTVAVSPNAVTLTPGSTQQFTATVAGIAGGAGWAADCGTITSTGLYTAPTTGESCTVTANSLEFPSATGTASVDVSEIAVIVSPASVSLSVGQTQQFTASVTGTADESVTWSATCGSITASGLFTASSEAGTCTITATSSADPDVSGTGSVTVQAGNVRAEATGFLAVGANGAYEPDPNPFPPVPGTPFTTSGCMVDSVPFAAPASSYTCTATSLAGSSSQSAQLSYTPTYEDGELRAVSLDGVVTSTAGWSSSSHTGSVGGNADAGLMLRFDATDWVTATFSVSINDVDGSSCGSGSSQVRILMNGQWHDFTDNGGFTVTREARGLIYLEVLTSSVAVAERLPSDQETACPSGSGSASASVNVTFEPYQL